MLEQRIYEVMSCVIMDVYLSDERGMSKWRGEEKSFGVRVQIIIVLRYQRDRKDARRYALGEQESNNGYHNGPARILTHQ
jgi:hypothetical protein